jgi:ABC-type amino acid transport substrate-binding protein
MKSLPKKFVLVIILLLATIVFRDKPIFAADSATTKNWQDELITEGVLLVGMCTDYPPYESLNTNGEIEGFDVDIAVKLAESMGLTLKIQQLSFPTIISALQIGQIDIGISAFGYKEDRDVLFSTPYIKADQVMTVNKSSGITKLDQLSGKSIAVGAGTTCEVAAKATVPESNIVNLDGFDVMFAALANGAVDAVASERKVAMNFTENSDNLVILDTVLATDGTHVIVRKGNNLLLEKVDAAITALLSSTDYKNIMDKWEMN